MDGCCPVLLFIMTTTIWNRFNLTFCITYDISYMVTKETEIAQNQIKKELL